MVIDGQLLKILKETRHASGAPALASVVVRHDRVVFQAALGGRRLGDDTPVTIDDKFHIGSNGKAWTATTCAALVDRGLIAWNITPLDLFPDLASTIQPAYEKITLEMLLRHTAGIPPYTEEEHFESVPAWDGSPTEQRIAFARWLLQEQEPVNEPGTEMSYSNAGYGIAAAFMEAVVGRSWEEMVEDYLNEPLGIDAGFGWPAAHDRCQPFGHSFQGGEFVVHQPDDDYVLPPIIAPAGDLHVSMPHYARFLQANLRALQGRETILPVGLFRQLHNHGEPGTGLGWGVQTIGSGGLFSAHIGGAGTFICVGAVAHARDLGVAMATNAGSEPDEPVEEAIRAGFKAMIEQCVASE